MASSSTSCPLSVKLASQDLPPIESLLQTFNNLQQLNLHIEEAFSRLHVKIGNERSKINSIQERLKQANAKVTSIENNPSRACTIYSAPQYPGATTGVSFEKIVKDGDKQLPKPINVLNYRLGPVQRGQRAELIPTDHLVSELATAATSRTEQSTIKDSTASGLGKLPCNIESASALVLFNSTENPYKQYTSFNNLESVADARNKVRVSKQIASAPQTISEGTQLPIFTGLQFEFRPDLGVVPTIALPQTLDLKNIASIQYNDTNTTCSTIAPSVLAELPSFGLVSPGGKQTVSGVPSNLKALNAQQAPPPAAANISAPPPPAAVAAQSPPPPAAVSQAPLPAAQAPQAQQAQVAAPVAQSAPAAAVPSAPKLPAAPQPGRGSLLDSIKAGSKLRSIATTEPPVAGNPSRAAPAPAGPSAPDFKSLLYQGIKRRAEIMNGRDPVADAKPQAGATPSSGIGSQLSGSLQSKLSKLQQESDNDSSAEDSDW